MRRAILAAIGLSAACHGIEHPASLTSPTATVAANALTLVAIPPQLPAGGGTVTIDVGVMPSDGRGATVTLQASGGTLARSTVTTDSSGHARVEWSGDRSSAITAASGGLGGSVTVNVAGGTNPAPTPPDPNPNPSPEPTPPTPNGTISVGIDAGPSPAYAGDPMRFAVGVQILPPAAVTSIRWDFDQDGQPDATNWTPAWTYAAPGSHAVTVVVTTADGRRGEASVRFTVRPVDDFEIGNMRAAPETATTRTAVTWSVDVTVLHGSLPPLVYRWDFDGNGSIDATTSGPSATTAYLSAGTRTASVTATSAAGVTSAASGSVIVSDPK